MKPFRCPCGNALFFESSRCLHCGQEVGYDPAQRLMRPARQSHRLCANGQRHAACNWLLPAASSHAYCLSCRLNRTIPDLTSGQNLPHWRLMEAAKRRLLYSLIELGIPLVPQSTDPQYGLAFDIVSTTLDPTATTGHLRGVITVSLEEADDTWRQINRQQLGEAARTLLGHFRHESGHYLWYRHLSPLPWDHPWRTAFREIFGCESLPYASSLTRHYQQGPPPGWQQHYISGYAASHPWEDWAETWAHYLQMADGFETCGQLGIHAVSVSSLPAGSCTLPPGLPDCSPGEDTNFHTWLQHWISLATTLNEISRSFGAPFLYPYIISPAVARKLRLAHQFARLWH